MIGNVLYFTASAPLARAVPFRARQPKQAAYQLDATPPATL